MLYRWKKKGKGREKGKGIGIGKGMGTLIESLCFLWSTLSCPVYPLCLRVAMKILFALIEMRLRDFLYFSNLASRASFPLYYWLFVVAVSWGIGLC